MSFSYEVHLWGGLQKVSDRLESNRRILNDFHKLLLDRANLEADFQAGFQKVLRKWKYDEPELPSIHSAVTSMKDHCDSLPPIHQEVSDFVMKDLVRPLDVMRKDLATQRDKLFNDISILNKDLRRKTDQLKQTKQDYFKLHASMKEAQANLIKSKSDPMFPAKQLSKLASTISKLEKQTADAHKAYQTSVASFQKFQQTYENQMKGILRSFQDLDEKCHNFLKDSLKIYLEKQSLALQKVARHDENFTALAERLDLQDIERYIEQTTTGAKPEPLVEYQPYVSSVRPERGSSAPQTGPTSKIQTNQSIFDGRRTSSASSSSVSGAVPFLRQPGASQSSTGEEVTASSSTDAHHDDERIEIPQHDSPARVSLFTLGRQGSLNKSGSNTDIASSSSSSSSISSSTSSSPTATPTTPHVETSTPKRKARALYDYVAQENSEIGFKVGDIITIINSHDSGWWNGEIGGKVGMFPAPYVVEISDDSAQTDTPTPSAAPAATVEMRVCAFTFQATESNELSMEVGDVLEVISTHGDWYMVRNAKGEQGLIPGNYTQPKE